MRDKMRREIRRRVMPLFLIAHTVPVTLISQTTTHAKPTHVPAVPTRRWLPAPTLVRTIVGPEDDELLMPGSLVVTSNGNLALFDFGGMELRAFSVDGRQLWRMGRKGSGPGEFRNAMDVKTSLNGELSVLDMGNRRITSVSSSGRLIRTIPLRFSSSRFVPLADSTLYGLTTEDSGSFWSAVNTRGDVVGKGIAPATIAVQHTLAREMFTSRASAGSVVVFRWSDKIAMLDANGRITSVADGIEPLPFPAIKSYPMKMGKFTGRVSRIDPHAVAGALSVTSNGDEVFVLFAGATPNRGRIIDAYNAKTGAYMGSRLLPTQVVELVALPDGAFATLRSDPIPSIDIWKSPVANAKTHTLNAPASASVKKGIAQSGNL